MHLTILGLTSNLVSKILNITEIASIFTLEMVCLGMLPIVKVTVCLTACTASSLRLILFGRPYLLNWFYI